MLRKANKSIVEEENGDGDPKDARVSAWSTTAITHARSKNKRQHSHRETISSSVNSLSKGSDSALSRPLGFGLRRAVLFGRRGGPSTPVPSWKVSDSSLLKPSFDYPHLQHGHQDQGFVISARKLAASLWEFQESEFSKAGSKGAQKIVQQKLPSVHRGASLTEEQNVHDGQHLSPALSHISKGSHKGCLNQRKSGDKGRVHAKLEKIKGHQVPPDHRREITANGRHTHTSRSLVLSSRGILNNLSCGPTTTSDLLKILNHVWNLEEQHVSSMSLIGTLRVELDEARSQLQELLLNKENLCKEAENLSARIAEERALWKEQQEQYNMVPSVMQELENERKSKQKLEVRYTKVAKEFRAVKKSLLGALEDLEQERKARKLMEGVCDELAIEIGQDKARVEELKLESVKVREEVEEERKMLQMAEIWREERVHMKLLEAKLELEEKNTALDKLRSHLEDSLNAKRAGDSASNVTSDTKQDSGRGSLDIVIGSNLSDSFHSREHRGTHSGSYSTDSGCNHQRVKQNAWTSYSDDDDDLHSIELHHEQLVKTANSNWSQQAFQQREREIIRRGLSDDSNSTSNDRELETARTDQQTSARAREGAGAESSAQGSVQRSCRWVGQIVKGGEIREWRREQEGGLQQRSRKSTKSWSIDVEDSHLCHEHYAKIVEWQDQSRASNMVSSPTKQWNYHDFTLPDSRSRVATESLDDAGLKTKS